MLKKFHATIFCVSRPYENILTMKMFKFREQSGYSAYICRAVAIGRSKGIMYSLSPHYKDKTNPFVGEVRVAVRQGSPQCGGSILKKGVIVDRLTFTVKNESTKVHKPWCRHNAFSRQILVGGCDLKYGAACARSGKQVMVELSPRSRRTEHRVYTLFVDRTLSTNYQWQRFKAVPSIKSDWTLSRHRVDSANAAKN